MQMVVTGFSPPGVHQVASRGPKKVRLQRSSLRIKTLWFPDQLQNSVMGRLQQQVGITAGKAVPQPLLERLQAGNSQIRLGHRIALAQAGMQLVPDARRKR